MYSERGSDESLEMLMQKIDEQSAVLISFQNKCSAVNLYDS